MTLFIVVERMQAEWRVSAAGRLETPAVPDGALTNCPRSSCIEQSQWKPETGSDRYIVHEHCIWICYN